MKIHSTNNVENIKTINVLIRTWYKNGMNYGQLFQAYALQKYILTQSFDRVNYKVKILKLEDDKEILRYKIIKKIYLFIKEIYNLRNKNLIKKIKFSRFINRFLLVTSSVFSQIDLEKYLRKNRFELLLTGSDQLWNPEGNLKLCDFWPVNGDFIKASYGTGLMRKELYDSNKKIFEILKAYSQYIKKYNYISVRELDGKKILNQLISNDIKVVLDPTLLLPSELWQNMAAEAKIKVKEKKYIAVYILGEEERLLDIVYDVSLRLNNINVYVIQAEEKLVNIHNFRVIRAAGPEEFLAWMSKAEWVLTNSFHGTVFSIIFKKNFYAFPAVRKGFDSNMKRVTDLLDKLHLTDRYIEADITKFSEIEYSKVDDYLKKSVSESKNYLNTILNVISEKE